jgi:YbbR domain-containing protein
MDRKTDWLNAVKEYGKDYVLENTGLKVLALLITAVLWLSVASRPISEITMYNVPIEFKNLPQDTFELTVSRYDPPTEAARVYIRGPRDVLDNIRASDLVAYVDLSDVQPGVRVRNLQLDASRLPVSVVARVLEPRSLRVTLERTEEREVQVRPRIDGVPPEGYEVTGKTISPNTVRITGAASQVREINEVSTETVSLTDRRETFHELVTVDLANPNVNFKDESARKVMLTVFIGEVRKERTFDRVPIVINGASANVRFQPSHTRVVLVGARSAIEAMTVGDIKISATYERPGSGPRELKLQAEISPAYADLVKVESLQPSVVRLR